MTLPKRGQSSKSSKYQKECQRLFRRKETFISLSTITFPYSELTFDIPLHHVGSRYQGVPLNVETSPYIIKFVLTVRSRQKILFQVPCFDVTGLFSLKMAKRRTHNQRNNMNANKNRNNKNTPKKERDQTEDSETYIAEDNDQVKGGYIL